MAKYDAGVALEILGTYAEQKNPSASLDAKAAAARELLEELAAFDRKMVDLAARRNPGDGSVALGFSFGGATVFFSSGKFGVLVDDLKVQVPVRFNRARGVFEGEAIDELRVPVPGELKARPRDALGVIARTIVDAMKNVG